MQIQERAVLVKLSIGMPGNTRKDTKLTDEVQRDKHMTKQSGRWLKQLYPDEALEPLKKAAGEAREWHYLHTLPWTDEGWRILPTVHHFEYAEHIGNFRAAYEGLAQTHFVARYDEWLDWALKSHNGTFDPKDYPGAAMIGRKFQFNVDFTPVPSGEDFRVKLNAVDMEIMQQQVNTRVSTAVDEARRDLWRRLMEPLGHMVERLKEPDAVFRDSLIGNLREIVGLLPALNVTEDEKLAEFRMEIERELCKAGPDTLRDSKPTRAEVARKAEEILKRMEGYA